MDPINLLALLCCSLKSDEIIDLLERNKLEVVYVFDRLHEGIVDSYRADARSAGFQLRFNQNQVLDTILCYVKQANGFNAIDVASIGVPIYRTRDEARRSVARQGLSFSSPDAELDGHFQRWLRIDLPHQSIRYQFSHGDLDLITLTCSH
jgi:hypothetical protein